MTEPIRFTKMHGAGNDYIYVNTMAFPVRNPEELAIRLSAPHTGIGSDGLVLIGSSKIADFSMRIFNADGSEAMMCGNASRCIGKYVYDKRLTNKKNITLETLSGIKELQLTTRKLSGPHEEVTEVTVDMGCPVIGETALESRRLFLYGNGHLDGESASCHFCRRYHEYKSAGHRTFIGMPSAVPEPDECRICPGAKYRRSTDEGLGTRFRHYASLWDRSLCDSRSKRSARENRTKNQSRHGWRPSYHPLG